MVRSECAILEHQATEALNDILREIIEDIANLEKSFLKVQPVDVNEVTFLKHQCTGLAHEKTKIQQEMVAIDQRITANENEIGYE